MPPTLPLDIPDNSDLLAYFDKMLNSYALFSFFY